MTPLEAAEGLGGGPWTVTGSMLLKRSLGPTNLTLLEGESHVVRGPTLPCTSSMVDSTTTGPKQQAWEMKEMEGEREGMG